MLRATVEQSVHILTGHLPAVTLLLGSRGVAALERRRVIDGKLTMLVQAAEDERALRDDILPRSFAGRLMFGTLNSLAEWYRSGGPVDADVLAR